MFFPLLALSFAALSSLTGLLIYKKSLRPLTLNILIGMGAGVMTSISLTHILPEAAENIHSAGAIFFLGFCAIFLLDYFQCTHPHVGHEDQHDHTGHTHKRSLLGFSGLFIHTFFDGVAIITAFSISNWAGFLVTVGVVLHQIPVSLALVGISRKTHFSSHKNLALFGIFALSLLLGGLLVEILPLGNLEPYILAFAGGTLLYVGAADLLPELK
jgi:zinc transporter ZupT